MRPASQRQGDGLEAAACLWYAETHADRLGSLAREGDVRRPDAPLLSAEPRERKGGSQGLGGARQGRAGMKDWKKTFWIAAGFAACYWLPVGAPRFDHAVGEALGQVRAYAREHVLLGMAPAFFIAGAIKACVRREAILAALGPGARRWVAYAVAAISGAILTVCSCTVLPLFEGIYRMGAGIGPACAFLYSGPAINVTAMIITARVLGFELGLARALGAALFSVVIGLSMQLLFRRAERNRNLAPDDGVLDAAPNTGRPGWQTALLLACLVGILIAANWSGAEPCRQSVARCASEGAARANWWIVGALAVALGVMLRFWWGVRPARLLLPAAAVAAAWQISGGQPVAAFVAGYVGLGLALALEPGETREWVAATWASASLILPLLLAGIFISGFLLGRPGSEGVIPSVWVRWAVGGDSLRATFLAAGFSALMYFSTCTEVPVLEGLIGAGMGQGPSLALLLAGPALSLPGLLLLHRVLGVKKAAAFVALVVLMATATGWTYGRLRASDGPVAREASAPAACALSQR